MLMQEVLCGVVLVFTFAIVYLSASPLDPARHTRDFDLNSWIRYYEPAHYDPSSLVVQHNRIRRSVGQQRPHHVQLDIKGQDRLFKIRLTPDKDVFAEDVTFESTRGPIRFDPRFVYTGTLEDDESASVHGIVTKEGLFEGTISTAIEDYYVEPVGRYLRPNETKQPSPFHSIVYKSSDVRDLRKGAPCASHRLHLYNLGQNTLDRENRSEKRSKRWLLEAEAKLPYDDSTFWHLNKTKHSFSPPFDLNQPIDEELDLITANRTNVDVSGLIFRNVNKRATIDPKKTTCMLYLQADHQFFQKYGTEEACIEVMTRHVQRVNAIYKATDFNQDGKADNITFMVKRIKVHTTDALRDPLYRFPNNYGVEKFLELFSGKCS
ncbi:hypothetical protein MTP99_014750 [Tenebrio molitor]|nr:hypothetical protein MTP99_014750 [Tenebrio molitor]